VNLTVQYATRARPVPSARNLRKWVKAALRANARLTVRLVGLAEGRALNRAYRGKDYATNVLTFVLTERPPYDGDLALCAPVVSREARAQRKDLMAHYAHLTVHGVLHLQGYRHELETEAMEMEKLETRILKRLGFTDPYATQSEHG
jgi:probable rRNA maturation factor